MLVPFFERHIKSHFLFLAEYGHDGRLCQFYTDSLPVRFARRHPNIWLWHEKQCQRCCQGKDVNQRWTEVSFKV